MNVLIILVYKLRKIFVENFRHAYFNLLMFNLETAIRRGVLDARFWFMTR